MDDVWLVIGLLLFGSLLFCLCCYKVTNLLYMLYHIDDATESLTGNEIVGVISKTFTENWDSKAPSVGTLLAYLETTA